MIREIRIYPDPVLKEESKPVTEFDEKLHTLLDDMYETMIAKNGIGLAAVQIGVLQQVLVINLPREDEVQYKEDLLEIINPEFSYLSEEEETFTEGCLSVPEFFEDVKRSREVKLHYRDRFGKEHTMEASGMLAIALQHEIDHLNGRVFVEKLSFIKRKKFEKDWKKTHKKR